MMKIKGEIGSITETPPFERRDLLEEDEELKDLVIRTCRARKVENTPRRNLLLEPVECLSASVSQIIVRRTITN